MSELMPLRIRKTFRLLQVAVPHLPGRAEPFLVLVILVANFCVFPRNVRAKQQPKFCIVFELSRAQMVRALATEAQPD